MLCPYCLQGSILKVQVIATNEAIWICEECDTVWNRSESITQENGINLDNFLRQRHLNINWKELTLDE